MATDSSGIASAIPRAQVGRLINPQSIAIIGVSERPESAGRRVLANLDAYDYRGDVYLVGRTAIEIDGRDCLSSVDDLPLGLDCAVLAVPGSAIEETLSALARREVASVMCFASGFAETGNDGKEIQKRISAICRDHDIAFAGPNCMGLINNVDNLALTFAKLRPAPQPNTPNIGILVQSGGMGAVMRTAIAAAGLGFTYSITTGNEAVIGAEDYLPFLIEDKETRVIVMMMEQIRRPQDFLHHAAAARKAGKPIVMLHLSRGEAAKHSATTHTGAMAGDYAVMEAFVRSENVVLVDTIDELIDVSTILAHYPKPPGGGIGIVTESGAFKGFALDFCESVGATMADLQPETRDAIAAVIPEFVEATNPVDLTAQAIFDSTMYDRSIDALLKDSGIGAVMLSVMVATPEFGLSKARSAVEGKGSSDKPVLCAFLGGDQPVHAELVPTLAEAGVPFFRSPERGIRAAARVLAYGDSLSRTDLPGSGFEVGPAKIETVGLIPEYEAKGLLSAAGLAIPEGSLARTAEEALEIAQRIGYPVAIKAQAASLTHKSDVGGVKIGLRDAETLSAEWQQMIADVTAAVPDIELDGILVEAMGRSGVEVVIGAHRDPAWGPTLMIGLGGVWTEALGDVRFLPANAAPDTIAGAIESLKGARLLHGYRGMPPADIPAFAAAAARVGAMMLETPQLTEIDINPLVVFPAGEGVLALDALMVAE